MTPVAMGAEVEFGPLSDTGMMPTVRPKIPVGPAVKSTLRRTALIVRAPVESAIAVPKSPVGLRVSEDSPPVAGSVRAVPMVVPFPSDPWLWLPSGFPALGVSAAGAAAAGMPAAGGPPGTVSTRSSGSGAGMSICRW